MVRDFISRKCCFILCIVLFLILFAALKWNAFAKEEKSEKKIVTSFKTLEKDSYAYAQKPDVRQLESIFPEELEAMLEDGTKLRIPVSWKPDCDLQSTNHEQYTFQAVVDEKQYAVEEAMMPKIQVSIRREEEKNTLGRAKQYKLIEKSNKYYNGKLRVGYFVVETEEGRKQAFCAQHQLTSPEVNDMLTESAVYTKKTDASSEVSRRLRKVLYYGWGGPKDIGPKPDTSGGNGQDKGLVNDASHFRRTSLAASVASNNADNTFGYGKLFLDYLDKNYPDAPDGFEVHMLEAPNRDNQNLVFPTYKPEGSLRLKKTSANPDLSENNTCYSFKGAEFGVYARYNSGTNQVSEEVGRLVTDEKGESNTIPVKSGTYYVKELKAPPGYALSTEIKSVKVEAGKTAEIVFTDRPQYGDVTMLLRKTDEEANQDTSTPTVSLAHAEFTVKFYPGLWEKDKNPEELGKKCARTWVFQTDDKGIAKYEESYLVEGDKLYKNSEGKPVIPLGTVTVQETKSPEGYLLNPQLFVIQITPEGEQEEVHTYQEPTVPEKLLKLELVKWQENTEIPIPGVEFEHRRPDGKTDIVTTNENGKLVIKGLQRGQHEIRETKVMDGYLLNGNRIAFEVDEENHITLTSEPDPEKGEIRFDVTEDGQIRVEVEDKLAPFQLEIHKKNEKEKKLEGAEFTLYSEKTCENVLIKAETDEKGMLRMEGLEIGKKYYLKETKAPKGYRIPTDMFGNPIVYEIWSESVPVQDKFLFYVNGTAYDTSSEGMFRVEGTKADRHGVVTILNTTLKKLPATGSFLMLPTVFLALWFVNLAWKRR